MAVPYPLSEIYYHVLVLGWRVGELWRKNDEIRIAIYKYDPGVEAFMKQTGRPLEDCLGQLQHLQLSLYQDGSCEEIMEIWQDYQEI